MVIKLGGTICCDVSASHEAYHSQSKGFNGFHISEGSPWPCWPLRSKQLGVVRFIDFCKRSQLFTADEASQVWKMLWASWECLFDCGIRMHQNASECIRMHQNASECIRSIDLWVTPTILVRVTMFQLDSCILTLNLEWTLIIQRTIGINLESFKMYSWKLHEGKKMPQQILNDFNASANFKIQRPIIIVYNML